MLAKASNMAPECRVGIAHHRAIASSSVSDTDPAKRLDRHRSEQPNQYL